MNSGNNLYEGRFTLRKIPETVNNAGEEPLTEAGADTIKVIELASGIDKWEKEVLFAEKGFYSLKGKEPSEKIKEYTAEVKRFIESEISVMKFVQASSKEQARLTAQAKIEMMRQQMEMYSKSELADWELDTYENALAVSIEKAVLYKKNPAVIQKALQNGIKILDIISKKEDWNKKLFGYKKKQFISDFYTALINALAADKDIEAYQYFQNCRKLINEEEQTKLEKQVNMLRVNITAYNWAQEIFSYKLEDKEFEKELNNIQDKEIKAAAEQFYSNLKKSDKRKKALEERQKNEADWQELLKAVQDDIDKAVLSIDYDLKPESIKKKKEYLRQMRETGAVKTDTKEFAALFKKMLSDFQSFKDKDISDYRGCLSKEDFTLFEKMQKLSAAEFKRTAFDFEYAKDILKNSDDNELYNFVSMCSALQTEYEEINKKKADFEARRKIIDAVLSGSNERKGEK